MGNIMSAVPDPLASSRMENIFCKKSETEFLERIGHIRIQLYIGIAYGLIGINTRLVPEIVTYAQIFRRAYSVRLVRIRYFVVLFKSGTAS